MAGTPGNSGGRRTGRPGRKYPNRTDLRAQPAQAVPGQTYGEAGQQLAAQKAIPLGTPAPIPSAPVPSSGVAAGAGGGGAPIVPLSAPSTRPNEPLTSGVPSGPGPGPSGPPQDPTLAMLQGAYSILPTPGLLSLIQEAQHK